MLSEDTGAAVDATDREIVRRLLANGRASWAEMAAALGLSAPAVAERVKKLEQRGLIRGYAALVDAEQVGAEILAYVAVRLDRPKHRASFLERVAELDAVLECHHVAGDDDYWLKVRVGRLRDLEAIVSAELKAIEGVTGTRTTVVLSTMKETLAPPLFPSPKDPKEKTRRRAP